MPFAIACFYWKNSDKWDEKKWRSRWGSALEGMDTKPHPYTKRYDKRWAVFFPTFLLLRRVAFVVAGMSQNLTFQLLTLLASIMTSSVYLIALMPLEEDRDSKLEVFNEMTSLILLYHLVCFSDIVPQHHIRYNLGYPYISVAFINIAVHLVLIVRENVKVITIKIKRKYSEKKRTKKSLMTEYNQS